MMNKIHTILTYSTALIWFVNGFICKVLNLVPRHQQIVTRILGPSYSRAFTVIIGLSEILIAIWIISRIKPRLNACLQITVIALMNAIEFLLVPDLLLWGKLNCVFSFLLITVIFYNEFYLNKKLVAAA